MKSALYGGKNKIVLVEKENRKLRQNEVAIKVECCGISKFDSNIFNGTRTFVKAKRNVVLGQEFSGTITEVGKRVTKLKVGDRVCVDPNLNCGNCSPCLEGNTQFCENMTTYGVNADGGFKEVCLVNERAVYKLGNKTSFKNAALVQMVGNCLHGIEMCDISPASQVVIIGGNSEGLTMVQLAKVMGASKIALIEPVAHKREQAIKLGADFCIDPNGEETTLELLQKARFTKITTVIECLGTTSSIDTAISLCGNKGTVLMSGLTAPNDKIRVKPFELFKKEISLKTAYLNPKTHQRVLDLLDTGRINVTPLIHKAVTLEEIETVLSNDELLNKGKILVTLNNEK